MAYVLAVLPLAALIFLFGLVGWGRWVSGQMKTASETPLTTPAIVISEPGWRFRLPWFRKQHAMLERAGYAHIGWIDERYHPRLVLKHSVFWNAEHQSYAFVISVLGKAYVLYLAMAERLLVRTGATDRGYYPVGPSFVDGGYRNAEKRRIEHHDFIARERRGAAATGAGDLREASQLLRARAVRGAPQDPPFSFGEPELAGDEHVEMIPFMSGKAQLFQHCAAVFGLAEGEVDSWGGLFALLVIVQRSDDARIVLRHERYPGVAEESDEYLDVLRDAAWWNDALLVTFDQRPN